MTHSKTNPDGWTCYYSGSITAGDANRNGSASFTVQVNAPNSDQASWGPQSDSNSDIPWPPANNATLLESGWARAASTWCGRTTRREPMQDDRLGVAIHRARCMPDHVGWAGDVL